MKTAKIVVGVAIGLAVLGIAAFAMLAHENEITPIARPDPSSFDPKLVERGRVLANFGDCTACHTRSDGEPFAGNLPLHTPFGTIYTSNITPDPDTGIGRWSKEAFRRALKHGVGRAGEHLYPAFPYDQFAKVKDEDIDAIYAYLIAAVAPVKETMRDNELGFPFNIRPLLAVWKLLFLDKTPFQPDPTRTAEWNDGAYLVEGLGHCAACHTPRNILGARSSDAYGGGVAEGWYAPPLNKDALSQQPWTRQELVIYLMDGWHVNHGMAAGPMTPVVDALHKQNEIDVFAIAAYLETLLRGKTAAETATTKEAAQKLEWGHPETPPLPRHQEEGARLFQTRCAQCHHSKGGTVPLALLSAVQAPEPGSVVRAIMNGIRPPVGALGRSMPAFGPQMSDAEIATLVKFVRARYSTRGEWSRVEDSVKDARAGK